MPEEYFDVAYINFDKVILHGRATAGRDEFGCRIERRVEQVLSDEQRDALVELNERHHTELNKLLSSFVDRDSDSGPQGQDA